MHTRQMLGKRVVMTCPTIHRIEPALVPAIVGADMAIETFRRAVRAVLKVRHDVVALATRVLLLYLGGLQPEWQADDEGEKNRGELVDGKALGSGTAPRRQVVL